MPVRNGSLTEARCTAYVRRQPAARALHEPRTRRRGPDAIVSLLGIGWYAAIEVASAQKELEAAQRDHLSKLPHGRRATSRVLL